MGLKDIFSRKGEKKPASYAEIEEAGNKPESTSGYVFGIWDTFSLPNSDDLVVTGWIKGTIYARDTVYLANPGQDNDTVISNTIVEIRTSPHEVVQKASDCYATIRLEKGKLQNIKRGMVLFSKVATVADVYDEYAKTVGFIYAKRQNLELSDNDIEELSITDCVEIWHMFSLLHSKKDQTESEETKQENKRKLDILGAALCKKILEADAIYCVYSKDTGEPYMFSQTVKQNDEGYLCTPPNILIFAEADKRMMEKRFSEEQFEIKKIGNGESKDGIYNFLGSTFYLNGACGASIISEQTTIVAGMLVPPPDYSNARPQDIPVTNPALVRWILLLGQLSKPEGADAELVYTLYYRFMSKEMVKAKFLIPVQSDSELPKGDENGETVLKQGAGIKLPTMEGKYDRPAVRMYTDWKRLRMVYGTEWNGLVQSIDGMIGVFDCAINVTEYLKAGSYISADMFEEMKKFG